jgi:hypothetical protein
VFAVSVGDSPERWSGVMLAGASAALSAENSGTILVEDLVGVLVAILKDQKAFTIRRVYLVDVVLKAMMLNCTHILRAL